MLYNVNILNQKKKLMGKIFTHKLFIGLFNKKYKYTQTAIICYQLNVYLKQLRMRNFFKQLYNYAVICMEL